MNTDKEDINLRLNCLQLAAGQGMQQIIVAKAAYDFVTKADEEEKNRTDESS